MKNIFRVLMTITYFFLYYFTYGQVKADFIFDKNEGCGTLAVSFTDKSTSGAGNIVEWQWDLGGVFSAKQNPGIIFNTPGEYTICLTIKTSNGSSSQTCKEKVIKIYENPIADFGVDIFEGCSPVEVTYQNLSKSKNGSIVSWLWDIGGSANIISTTDSLLEIFTTYNTEGNYTSTLSIVDEKGCTTTSTKPNLVKITSPPKVILSYEYLSACDLPWDVKIDNIDPDPAATYQWDFGNGQTYTGANPPIVKYNEAKDYNVSVIVKKGPCLDTIIFANAIKTNRITDFSVLSEAKCANQIIKLQDISNYTADSVRWDFGDGTTSNILNPDHIYSNPGCYVIKLTKYIGSCIQEITKPCISILPVPIVNHKIENGYSCLIPAEIKLSANADTNGRIQWTIKGTNLDSTLIGSDHDIIIRQFGKYPVSLSFISDNGCQVIKNDLEIDITKFNAELPTFGPKGCVPYNAILSDSISSNIPILSWYWEVGNPAVFTSTLQNPIFPVSDTGSWDIKLIVENTYGCKDTILRNDYIQGGNPPVVNFAATPLQECLQVPRQFTNLTSANADFWIWTYNDTILFSSLPNPEYTFNNFGSFDITLTAFHNGCSNQLTLKDYIVVYKPLSSFAVNYRCEDPYTIDIMNQSLEADIYYWVVKLSPNVTDTIRDSLLATYTFPDRGTYFLSHYSKSLETGCEHIRTDSIFIVDLEASYTLDTIRGCAPLDVKVSSTIRDAVKSEFLPGQYTILNEGGNEAIVTFTEGGLLLGPQLVVTDRHGCKDTFQTSTPVEVSKIDARIDAPDVVCIPGRETFLDGSTLGLGNIVSREWYFSSENQTSQSISPDFDVPNAGSYFLTLKLKDSWGCSDSVKKDLLAVTLIPSFTSDTLSCTDKGVRFLVDSDPTFLNAFSWTFGDGQTSNDKNPLHKYDSEGIFDVCAELFDSRGCSKKICKPKAVNIRNPIARFSGSPLSAPCPPLLSNFTNTSINASSYTWDFGDNSGLSYTDLPSHVYSFPGKFDVTLFAEMVPGCVDTLVIPEMIKLLGPTANVELSLSGNCVPLEIVLDGVSDKTYEYIWDFGDGQIEIVPGLTQNDTTVYVYDRPGRFVPKLLVSDDNGCSRTFTLDPVEVNNVTPKFIADYEPYCGLPSLVSIENKTTASSDNIQYEWQISGIKEFTSNEKNPLLIIDDYGKYSITLIASTINCIDTIQSDSLIEIAANPSLDFEYLTTLFCENSDIKISNNSTLDYGNIIEWNWEFSNNNRSLDKNPEIKFSAPGFYTVLLNAKTDKGCQSTISKSIQILPNTLISLTDDKTICIGDSINIKATINSNTNYKLEWDTSHHFQCNTCEIVNVKPEETTTYYIYTTAESGCKNTDSIRVTVIPEPGPQLQLSSDTIVCENGSIDISILNFDNSHSYIWDQNDLGLNCYRNCQTVKASPSENTYYSIIVTNSYGCYKEDSVLVTVERSIEDFLIPSKTICEGSQTILTNNGGNNPIWDFHPSMSCTKCDSTTVAPTSPTIYWVTVLSDAGCKYRDSVFIDIVPLASIDAGEDALICKGETVRLNGKGIGMVLWSSSESIQNATSLEASSVPLQSSIYYLKTIEDECILLDSIKVNVIEKTTIQAMGDTICPDDMALLISNGNAMNYEWYIANKKIAHGDTILVSPEKTTEYMVIGSRGLCKSDTVNVLVKVYPSIDYRLDEDEYEVFLNSKAKIKASFDEEKGYKYTWSPSTGLDCADCPQPTVQQINQSQIYNVTITDINQCTSEYRAFVKFNNKCSGQGFYIPNIFMPYKQDGINNFFKVYAEDAAEFISVNVFDRWGAKVYSSLDINESWNGFYNGQKLVQGVYTYIITARCEVTNEIFHFAGDVTIIE
jgi:gliding motility-associated-like protein